MKLAPAVVLSLLLTQSVVAATRHWTGAMSDLWSDPQNWTDGAPVAGDDLVFPPGTNWQMLNDYPDGTYFQSITFPEKSFVFSVRGNRISLGPGGWTQSDYISVDARVSLSLVGSQTWRIGQMGVYGGFHLGSSGEVAQLDLGSNTLTITGGEVILCAIVHGTGAVKVLDDAGLIISGGSQLNFTGPLSVGANAGLLLVTAASDPIATPIVINDGGFFSPQCPAVLAGSITLKPGSTFEEIFNPPLPPGEYFLTVKAGVITLGGALDTGGPISPDPLGTTYTVIRNETGMPVVGTFAGLPEGTIFTPYAGNTYRISYRGGSGYDVTLTVVPTPTVTTLTSSCAPSKPGESVTFTATVSPAATGDVTFFDGAISLGTVTLNNSSQASLTTSSLCGGPHNITARYSGTALLAGSTSAVVAQQVLISTAIPALDPRMLAALGALLAVITVVHMRR